MPKPPSVLPVTATFVRAYHLVWYNRIRLMQAGAIPFLCLAISNSMHLLLFAGIKPDTNIPKYFEQIPHGHLVLYFITELVGAWTLLSFNVSWRRYLLVLSPDVEPFYFRKPLWRYVAAVLLTFVGVMTAFALLNIILEHLVAIFDPGIRAGHMPAFQLSEPIYAALMLAGLCALIGLILRYYPFYTRMMTDEPHYTIHEIGISMRGNVLRLLVLLFMTFWTLVGCMELLVLPLALAHADPSNVTIAVIRGVISAFTFVTVTALLSAVAGLVYDFTLPEETRRQR
jgi:hypothetical protein